MAETQVERSSYQMPPKEGFAVTHFTTVGDIDRVLTEPNAKYGESDREPDGAENYPKVRVVPFRSKQNRADIAFMADAVSWGGRFRLACAKS